MTRKARIALSLVLAAALGALPASAQDSQTAPADPSPAAELPLGRQVVEGIEVGTSYLRETYGDWDLRCTRTVDLKDPCQLHQLMQDDKGNAVAEIALFPISGDPLRVAGATVALPLGTLLTEGLTVAVDSGPAKRYQFRYCLANGCYAPLGLTQEDIDAFKHGATANMVVVPVAQPNARVTVRVSLKGFTKGWEALLETAKALQDN